jgi:hypothetical protein
MSKPMFFFTGVYETIAQAEQDYDAIKAAARQRVSSDPMTPPCYRRTTTARFNVNKDEKPVKHGGWIGLAAGAGAAILFPPLAVGVHRCRGGRRGAGRMVWALGARHVAQRHQGMARQLQPGHAALIVIGTDEDSAKVEQATGASLMAQAS